MSSGGEAELQLCELEGRPLPVSVRVTEGYLGPTDDSTLAVDELLQLVHFHKEHVAILRPMQAKELIAVPTSGATQLWHCDQLRGQHTLESLQQLGLQLPASLCIDGTQVPASARFRLLRFSVSRFFLAKHATGQLCKIPADLEVRVCVADAAATVPTYAEIESEAGEEEEVYGQLISSGSLKARNIGAEPNRVVELSDYYDIGLLPGVEAAVDDGKYDMPAGFDDAYDTLVAGGSSGAPICSREDAIAALKRAGSVPGQYFFRRRPEAPDLEAVVSVVTAIGDLRHIKLVRNPFGGEYVASSRVLAADLPKAAEMVLDLEGLPAASRQLILLDAAAVPPAAAPETVDVAELLRSIGLAKHIAVFPCEIDDRKLLREFDEAVLLELPITSKLERLKILSALGKL